MAELPRTMQVEAALERVRAAVGPQGWTSDPHDMQPSLEDWRGQFQGRARMLVRPAETREVAEVVAACAAAGIPITPQGGNTGMCGGATPPRDSDGIVLSLARMNRIRAIDATNFTMTVEAGCVLQRIQEAALEVDRYFPLSLSAQGSCMIGGNLSTNAGGTGVLRYGNARELALGLEVVLPDGRTWDGLTALRKDNTGYDLKHLFMGAEGTLGIITAAVLKLFPRPRAIHTAWCAVPNVASALDLLARARAESGDAVETFELVSRAVVDLVLAHIPGTADPLGKRYAHYVLLELVSSASADDGLRERFQRLLEEAFAADLVLDAVVAQSDRHRGAIWALRENASEAEKLEGASIKHDVSVPVSAIPSFWDAAWQAVRSVAPDARLAAFGHAGDGNLHYNVVEPAGGDRAAFIAQREAINRAVHDAVHLHDGSISAEHGIGRLKRDELCRYKSPVAMDVMRTLKAALDPDGIMNRGALL